MLITTFIACTRAQRGQYLAHILRVAGRRAGRGLSRWRDRIAQAGRHRQDLAMLLADDRMLRDIGLSRSDVQHVIGQGRWLGASKALNPAAAWREETRVAEGDPHEPLPHVDAPSLAPTSPLPAAHENFR